MRSSLIINSPVLTDHIQLKDSPAYTVLLLLKLSSLSKLKILNNEFKSKIKNQQEFLSEFKSASFTRAMDRVLSENIEKQKLTWINKTWFCELELETLDSFFNIKDFVNSFGKISDLIWIKVEQKVFDRELRTLLEFLDSGFETKFNEYLLNAIVLKKKNVYSVIVETSLGVSYYKMTCVLNFVSWAEALFCAFEGDFYPCWFLYAKVNQDEKKYLEFLNDDVKDGIANLISLKKCEIKSVNKYTRYKDIEIDVQTDSDVLTQDTLEAFEIIDQLRST